MIVPYLSNTKWQQRRQPCRRLGEGKALEIHQRDGQRVPRGKHAGHFLEAIRDLTGSSRSSRRSTDSAMSGASALSILDKALRRKGACH